MKNTPSKLLSSVLCVLLSVLMIAGACVCASAAITDNAETGDMFLESNIEMYVGETQTFTGGAMFSNVTYSGITAQENGVIRYTKSGRTATVTAVSPGKSYIQIEVVSSDPMSGDWGTMTSKWNITVKAKSGSGGSGGSGGQSSNLAAPKIKSIECEDRGNRIKWDPVSGAYKYRLFLKNASGNWSKLIDTSYTNIYHNNDLVSGKSYSYTVRCIDSSGNYTSGYNQTGWTKVYNLGTPKINSITDTDKGAKIAWDPVTNAKMYRVYRKNSNGGWTKLGDTSSTYLVHTGAVANYTYTYTVRCLRSDGSALISGYNKTGWSHKFVKTMLATPQISKLESTADGIKLTWKTVSGAKKYRVFHKYNGKWVKLTDTTSNTFTHTGVKPGYTYTYTVRCISADGKTYTSDFKSAGWQHTYSQMLATPQVTEITKVTNGRNGIKLTWNPVAGAEKYRIFYKNDSGSWVKLADTTSTSYVDWNVVEGYTYTYTVRCITASGTPYTSGYNKTGWSYTLVKMLATPQISSLENTASGVKISWKAVSGAAKYRLFYQNSAGKWVKMADTTSTSYLDTDVESGDTYLYTIRCVSADGKTYTSDFNHNGWLHTYQYGSQQNADAPELDCIMFDDEDDIYVWVDDSYQGATDFAVFVKEGSSWRKIGTVKNYEGWILHANHQLTAGRSYYFTIRGIDSSGSYITPFNTQGFRVTLLSPPVVNGTFLGAGKARFYWSPVTGAVEYGIRVSSQSGINLGPFYTDETSFEVDFNAYPSSTWTVSVCALDENYSLSDNGTMTANVH